MQVLSWRVSDDTQSDFDTSGKVLGAQNIGVEGIEKRIDVIATSLRFDGTIYDLQRLELAYAPPYSSAKDPVNMAGFAAENILKKIKRLSYGVILILLIKRPLLSLMYVKTLKSSLEKLTVQCISQLMTFEIVLTNYQKTKPLLSIVRLEFVAILLQES